MNQSIIRKLTSRKFILAMLTAVSGIITMIIGDNALLQVITGAAMTIIPTVVYCIMEGKIDAASVKELAGAAADAAEKLGANEKTLDVIEHIGVVGEILVEEEA